LRPGNLLFQAGISGDALALGDVLWQKPIWNTHQIVVNLAQTAMSKPRMQVQGASNAHESIWKKIKLPATIAIKHQLMKLMFEESIKEAAESKFIARTEEIRRSSVSLN
jgi:hypothetical protein